VGSFKSPIVPFKENELSLPFLQLLIANRQHSEKNDNFFII
jgi:hypothetical protein